MMIDAEASLVFFYISLGFPRKQKNGVCPVLEQASALA